jgi:hypothetical protein
LEKKIPEDYFEKGNFKSKGIRQEYCESYEVLQLY